MRPMPMTSLNVIKTYFGNLSTPTFLISVEPCEPSIDFLLGQSNASDRKGERNKIKTTERKKEKEKKKSPNIFPLASICEAAPVSQVTRKDIPFSFSLISGDGNLLSAAAVPFRHRVVNAQACICIDMCLLLLLYRRRMRRRSFFFSPLYIKE